MKKLYLSHSQINTFKECERKWYLDKVERIRPTYGSSALLFGGAIDEAIEHKLLKKEGDYLEAFQKALANFKVNGKKITLPEDCDKIKVFAGDIDPDCLEQVDLTADFAALDIEPMEIKDFLEYCKQQRKNKEELEPVEQKLFNLLAFRTMQVKGPMLLEKLSEWIDENVAKVHEVQKKIEMDDGQGNKFIGYLDFIVTLKDGRKLLIDLKTSSNPKQYYPDDSAQNSPQLGIYAENEGLFNVAYLIIDKKLRKKDPKVRLRFVEGEITDEKLDEIFEEIQEIVELINEKLPLGQGSFDQNRDACKNFGNCPYIDLCWKGKMDNLEKV